MPRRLLVLLVSAAALLGSPGQAAAFSKQDVSLPMDDGVELAATLYLPDGAAPAGGWPAIVFLHGLSGKRQDMSQLAEAYGFVGEQYAVLAFDARGHGASGGLVGIDGPREVADTRAVVAWLAARPDIAGGRIGGFGISYGGGALWNSLAAGVPWAAIEVVETWTDLYTALVPQGLVKSGLVAGLAGSIPAARKAPELDAVQAAAFAGGGALGPVRPWAGQRSSLAALAKVRTPVFMMQGRRDFLFGIDQAARAFTRLKGPKRLWLGNHGHAPSSFPASDTTAMLAEGKRWFDRFLRGQANGIDRGPERVVVAHEGGTKTTAYPRLPTTRKTTVALAGSATIARSGKVQRTGKPLRKTLEVFGAPTVRVTVSASGGWSRLVAVLTARTPGGKEIVVAGGGVPVAAGTRNVVIRLSDQATVVPKGSRLTVTLGNSSLAQSASNLLYLDLPLPPSARAKIGTAVLTLPALPRPLSP